MPKPLEGVPFIGWEGALRLAGLATAGMLKQDRKRPADDQKPAAQYFTGFEYAPLYRLDEVVDLPPLSPGRQRRYDANRTCADCGKKAKTPFAVGVDGKRYCEPCQEPAAKRLWDREQAERRKASTAWAREVLADPRTVLVHEEYDWWSTSLRAETLAGELLIDVRVRNPRYPEHTYGEFSEEQLAASIAADELDRQLLVDLAGRRLIPWWERPLGVLVSVLRDAGVDLPEMRRAAGDEFGKRYTNWVGEPVPHTSYRQHRGPLWQHSPAEAADVIAKMRSALAEMAAEVSGG